MVRQEIYGYLLTHYAISALISPRVMADVTSPRNLNPPRRHRSYPRVVRRARHNSYRVKRPGDTGTRYHGPPTIRLVNLPATVMLNLGQLALTPDRRPLIWAWQ
jgi:hypothetical protein